MSAFYLVYTEGFETSAEVNFKAAEGSDIPLHIAFRPEERKLVVNAFLHGLWRHEANTSPADLAGVYRMTVDGEHVRIWRDGQMILEWSGLGTGFAQAVVSTTQDADLVPIDSGDPDSVCKKILIERGLADALWLSPFDAQDYVNLNPDLDLDPRDPAEALRHFITRGIAEGRPYSSTDLFDHAFYAAQAHDRSFSTREDAYLDWLCRGRKRGLSCSHAHFLHRMGNPPFPSTFTWPAYAAALGEDSQPFKDRYEAFAHLMASVEDGDPGLAALDAIEDPAEAAALLVFFGQRHQEWGTDYSAAMAYHMALTLDPDRPATREALGHCLFRLGENAAALAAFRADLEEAEPKLSVLVHLVDLALRMGHRGLALEAAGRLLTAFPEDDQARAAGRRARLAAFRHRRDAAHLLCQSGDRAGATRAMMAYRDPLPILDTGPIGAVEAPRRLPPGQGPRVLILGDPFLTQCVAYRINQKLEHLAAAGYDARFIPSTDVQAFLDASPFYDIAIFYRVPAQPDIVEAITRARRQGMVTLYEIDDLIFDPDRFPDDLASYGTDLTPFEHANLVVDTPLVLKAMELCDYGLTTTRALQDIMAPIVMRKQCFLHRNAFDARHARFADLFNPHKYQKVEKDTVTLLYGSGTKAHAEDFEILVAPALVRIFEKHPQARFMGIGYLPNPDILKPWAKRIDRLPPVWDLDAYWSLVADTDINLAMLKDNLISDCKSEIKWLEAAMLGVPSIVSPTRNYRETQRDGKTALFAATPDDWFDRLDHLVSSAPARHRLGTAAYDHAVQTYGIDVMARNIDEILTEVNEDARSPVRVAGQAARPIVTICNVFFAPQLIGGATRVVKDNVDHFIDRHGDAFEVQVFCAMEGGTEPYQVRSYGYRGARVTAVTHPLAENMDLVPFDPRMGEIFEAYLDHVQPDLVHFHCIQRLTASIVERTRARTIPYLITAHDAWWISDYQFLVDGRGRVVDPSCGAPHSALRSGDTRAASALARTMRLRTELTGAEHILAVSESFAETYRRFGVPDVTAIENGVSATLVPHPKEPHDGPVRLGLIGGMQPHKGLPLIRSTLLTHPFEALHLTIVDLSLPPETVGRREIWGTTPVQFIGKIPQTRVAELYARLDVLLAPSIWPESYGLVTREALQCGLWVIASDRGAIGADVTAGENGFVIDVSNTRDLLAAFTKIDSNPDRFRQPPQRRASLRSSDDQGTDLAALYKDMLRPRSRFSRRWPSRAIADRIAPALATKKSA
ncbi:MAG: glycosyltransferase [Alphaproteobacteria bacterium]